MLLIIALQPVWELASGTISLLSADEAPHFNSELSSIFNPNAQEDNPVTIYTEYLDVDNLYDNVYVEDIAADDIPAEEDLEQRYLRVEYADSNEDSDGQLAYIYERDDAEDTSQERRVAYMYVRDDDTEGAAEGQKVADLYLYADQNNAAADDTPSYVLYLNGALLEESQITFISDKDLSTGSAVSSTDAEASGNADDSSQTGFSAKIAYIIQNEETTDGEVQYSSIFRSLRIEPSHVSGKVAHQYIHIQDIELPDSGAHYANLSCGRINFMVPVYWDDTSEILRYGVGTYLGSKWPGFGRMMVLSAHNNSFFEPLQYMHIGDVIDFDTNYGKYRYRVTEIEVMNENDLQSYILRNLMNEEEVLVMYTCYPFEVTLGRKTDRFTVIAKRISGYDVKWRNFDE